MRVAYQFTGDDGELHSNVFGWEKIPRIEESVVLWINGAKRKFKVQDVVWNPSTREVTVEVVPINWLNA